MVLLGAAPAHAQLGAIIDGLLRPPPPRYYAPPPPPAYYPPPGYVYRPVYPAPVYVAPRAGLGGATVAEAQRMLSDLGYDPGPADGAAGPRVSDALRAFQRDRGLHIDGRLTADAVGEIRAAWRERERASVKHGGDGEVATVKSKPAPAGDSGGQE